MAMGDWIVDGVGLVSTVVLQQLVVMDTSTLAYRSFFW